MNSVAPTTHELLPLPATILLFYPLYSSIIRSSWSLSRFMLPFFWFSMIEPVCLSGISVLVRHLGEPTPTIEGMSRQSGRSARTTQSQGGAVEGIYLRRTEIADAPGIADLLDSTTHQLFADAPLLSVMSVPLTVFATTSAVSAETYTAMSSTLHVTNHQPPLQRKGDSLHHRCQRGWQDHRPRVADGRARHPRCSAPWMARMGFH